MPRSRLLVAALLGAVVLAALLVVASALDGGEGLAGGAPIRAGAAPTVYAAASLRDALPAIDRAARYGFGGSNTLQMQIERGAPADVFASASPQEALALFRKGRCTRPVTFATNVLVLLVPNGNPDGVRSVQGLRSGRRRLAVGTSGVPIGDYTRALLTRMGLSSVLRTNAVSLETSVSGIVAKVALRSAHAGFVYRTDAVAARARTDMVDLPRSPQPRVRYLLCAVRRLGARIAAAQRFIRRVTSAQGRQVLVRHGFGVPRS